MHRNEGGSHGYQDPDQTKNPKGFTDPQLNKLVGNSVHLPPLIRDTSPGKTLKRMGQARRLSGDKHLAE